MAATYAPGRASFLQRAGTPRLSSAPVLTLADMTNPLDQPFAEDDEIVGVTLVREDLRLLLVTAHIAQMDSAAQGRTDPRLQLAIHRIAATATSSEWQPKPKPD